MRHTFSIILVLFLFSCHSTGNSQNNQNIHFQPEDQEILSQIFTLFANEKDSPISVLMVKVGTYFMETPYVAHTLEVEQEKEELVVNLRELDCTTFAENCLAISRTIKSGKHTFEKFTDELRKIRYRKGKIEGYPSRLHYFSDWIFENDRKKLIQSVSEEIANIPFQKEINFMSTHPESYVQLKNNPGIVKTISLLEKEISEREMYYIPKEKIGPFKNELMDGDIIGITTNIEGLDIVHVGIIIRKSGKVHLLHASSDENKVVVSQKTFEKYLVESKFANGIMVARPF